MNYVILYVIVALVCYILLVSYLYGKAASMSYSVPFLMLWAVIWPVSILINIVDFVLFLIDRIRRGRK